LQETLTAQQKIRAECDELRRVNNTFKEQIQVLQDAQSEIDDVRFKMQDISKLCQDVEANSERNFSKFKV
jgi:predicted  nucleic acid-binding Zn-ribbon protein